ncbi:MAG: hypothetical protein ABJA98_00620 [Acidobacteriota bacterium]
MLSKRLKGVRAIAIGAAAMMAASALAPVASAQRRDDWDWPGNARRLDRLNAGTYLTVRTTQSISSDRRDGRIFAGVVADDVWDDYKRLAVPALPRGSRVEMVVRSARDGDLILDLQAVYAHGQRYTISAQPERVETGARRDDDRTTALVGGGAILGTVIGAIAGGGKGAAIGAAAGAATGLGVAFQGRSVRVPAGSLLTFRLERGLVIETNSRDKDRRDKDRRDKDRRDADRHDR